MVANSSLVLTTLRENAGADIMLTTVGCENEKGGMDSPWVKGEELHIPGAIPIIWLWLDGNRKTGWRENLMQAPSKDEDRPPCPCAFTATLTPLLLKDKPTT